MCGIMWDHSLVMRRKTMAKFMECKVCGVTTYVIHDWVKNLPCQACESNKKTLEQKEAWAAYAAKAKGEE